MPKAPLVTDVHFQMRAPLRAGGVEPARGGASRPMACAHAWYAQRGAGR